MRHRIWSGAADGMRLTLDYAVGVIVHVTSDFFGAGFGVYLSQCLSAPPPAKRRPPRA